MWSCRCLTTTTFMIKCLFLLLFIAICIIGDSYCDKYCYFTLYIMYILYLFYSENDVYYRVIAWIFPNIHAITLLLNSNIIFESKNWFKLRFCRWWRHEFLRFIALVQYWNLLHANFWLLSVGNIILLCNKQVYCISLIIN